MSFYVYAYIRSKDSNTSKAGTPYYIGKGKNGRAWVEHGNKTGGGTWTPKDKTKIIILETNLTEIGAFAIERRLIEWWGRKYNNTGILTNRHNGGPYCGNVIVTEEYRERSRQNNIGRTFSKETREKMSIAAQNRPPISEETRKKLSIRSVLHNANISDATREKLRVASTGRKCPPITEHHKQRIRDCNKQRWEQFGTPKWTDDQREKMTEMYANRKNTDKYSEMIDKMKIIALNREQVQCPHCGKIGSNNIMKRWHFDKCKLFVGTSADLNAAIAKRLASP